MTQHWRVCSPYKSHRHKLGFLQKIIPLDICQTHSSYMRESANVNLYSASSVTYDWPTCWRRWSPSPFFLLMKPSVAPGHPGDCWGPKGMQNQSLRNDDLTASAPMRDEKTPFRLKIIIKQCRSAKERSTYTYCKLKVDRRWKDKGKIQNIKVSWSEI